MKRNEQVYEILHQILTEQQDLLQKISPEIYTRKILSLDGATIGGHTRHIIEFLEILLNSYYSLVPLSLRLSMSHLVFCVPFVVYMPIIQIVHLFCQGEISDIT